MNLLFSDIWIQQVFQPENIKYLVLKTRISVSVKFKKDFLWSFLQKDLCFLKGQTEKKYKWKNTEINNWHCKP